jgi:signal transduction histidine kinase
VGPDEPRDPAADRDPDLGTRLRLLADRLPLALWVWEVPEDGDPRRAKLLVANEAAVRLRGRPDVATVSGAEASDLDASQDELAEFARVLALAGTDATLDLGTTERMVAGGAVVVRRVAFGLDHRTVGVVIEDVTRPVVAERGRAALLDRLLAVADHERRWLADALHDDTIQRLAAVVLSLDSLAARSEESAATALATVAEEVRDAIGQLRSLIFELAPPELDADGLAAAVRRTCQHLFGDGPPEATVDVRLPPTTAGVVTGVLYRVLVEALVNVAKHARAARVGVRVSTGDGTVRAVVVDDGVGPGPAAGGHSDPGHLGVRSMRDRCEQLGGSFRIVAGSGGGTVVEAQFPLAHAVDDTGPRRPAAPDWRPPEVRRRRSAPEEPRFERLVVPTVDLVACYSADLRVQYANLELSRRLGRSCLDLAGRRIVDVLPPDAARSATASVARVLRNGRPDRYVVDHPGGAQGGFDVLLVPDLDPLGRVVRVWSWVRELRPGGAGVPVTVAVAPVPRPPGVPADDARPPGRVGQLLRGTPDLVACLDGSGKFTWANDALLHVLERPLGAVVQRSPAEVGLPRRADFDEALDSVFATGVAHRTIVPMRRSAGTGPHTDVDVLLTPQYLLDDGGPHSPGAIPERVWVVARPLA